MRFDMRLRRLLSRFSRVTRFISFFFCYKYDRDARDRNVKKWASQVLASNRSAKLRVIKIFFTAVAEHAIQFAL